MNFGTVKNKNLSQNLAQNIVSFDIYNLFQQLVDKYKVELDKQGNVQIHIETNR